jgi:biotin operon repressor
VTVLHGDGGAGKGSLAALWVAQVTIGGGRVLVIDLEGHPQEWRRRVVGLGGDPEKVLWVGHQTGYLEPQGMPGVDLVVVDSAGYLRLEDAPATDWGPDVPVMLQDAAKVSGVPWLVLAHHSKTSDGTKAFGSVFWHNVPRASYSLVKDASGARTLSCHKATDMAADLLDNEWDVLGTYASDGVTPTSMTLVRRVAAPAAPLDEVWEALDDVWVGASELAETLELSRNRVSSRLGELVKQGRAVKRREGRVVTFRRASFGYGTRP